MQIPPQNPSQNSCKPRLNQSGVYTDDHSIRYKGATGELAPHQKRQVEIDELDRLIGKLNRSINASCYELLVLIREFDERAGWLAWSFTDGVSWLRWRCDLGVGAAREKIRIAHALKELPVISREFSAGNLSYSKVRVLTRIATRDNEKDLVVLARKMTVRHLTEHCKQRSNAQADSTRVAKAAQVGRHYRVWHDDVRGTTHISIEVPAEEGALIEQAVEKAAVQQSAESGAEFVAVNEEPSWSALQADAVVAVMREFLETGSSEATVDCSGAKDSAPSAQGRSRSTADHYQVVVHVDECALVSRSFDSVFEANFEATTVSNSETARTVAGGSPDASNSANPDTATSQYPIETVRRLCCDGSIIPIIENAKGEPLNVGRKVRTVTTAIRRALWARDRGCAFPGCSHTRFVDAHHIRHWADGGETSVENLVLLCSRHHKLVHEGGYSIVRDQSDSLFFKRPDGIAVPDCGYFREDWIDISSDGSVESALSREAGLSVDKNCIDKKVIGENSYSEKTREFFADDEDDGVNEKEAIYHVIEFSAQLGQMRETLH